jgi:hypothetical protein
MKQIVKLRANKEKIVSNIEMKQVINQMTKKVEDIVPKQTMSFEKLLIEDIAKLNDSDRILA